MPIAKSLEVWTAQTLCDIGILLSLISFLLHVGRPYFERILGRMTLRVAADLWWLAYVLFRDGTLFLAVLLGFLNLNLDLMADIKIGLPFVPLATVAMSLALVTKVFHDAEDVNRSYRQATNWVIVGAVFNTLGYVLVMEAPGQEYAVANSAFWQTMYSWRSNANPELSVVTFYVAFLLLGCVALFASVRALKIFAPTQKAERTNVQT